MITTDQHQANKSASLPSEINIDWVADSNASANLFSLIESAKLHGLDPVKYLPHVFKELPNCKVVADYEALLPYAVCDEKLKISR